MKTLRKNGMLLLCFLTGCYFTASSQDQSSVPGDDFSLEGALELFKKSSSPEEFEKMLNSEDGKVNNLDLNGDNNIDYIKVIDRNEGNVHAFILQAVISENESQDVAVIELEKLANGKAVLQITGDADIYGIETIIEPTEEVRVNAGASTARTVVNVWAWPSVQYVYSPYYTVWVSPWAWSVRPIWWRPWRPISYFVYDPWWQPYRPYYSVCYTHRIGYAHQLYRPYRTTSVIVYNRHHTQIAHYRSTRGDQSYGGRGRSDHHSNANTYRSRSDHQSNGGSRHTMGGRSGNNGSTGNPWRGQQQQNTNGRQRTFENRNSNSVDRSWSADNGRSSRNFRSNGSEQHSIDRQQLNNSTGNSRSGSFGRSTPNTSTQRSMPSFDRGSMQQRSPSFQRGSSPGGGRSSQPAGGQHNGGNHGGGGRGRH